MTKITNVVEVKRRCFEKFMLLHGVSESIFLDENGDPSRDWRMNNDRSIRIAICQLNGSDAKLETQPYYNGSSYLLSPQDALAKAYPDREAEIRAATFCEWTMHFNVKITDHA